MRSKNQWKISGTNKFWSEIAPSEHVVQFYENEDRFLDTLAGFVVDGINAGDSVVVIATPEHRKGLEDRLTNHVININSLLLDDLYIPLDAASALKCFMVDGMPDEVLFNSLIKSIVNRGLRKNRKVRAFGEMVGLLWMSNQKEATIRLEEMWDKFCQEHHLSLLCAYSKSIFDESETEGLHHICKHHSKIITDSEKPLKEILYQATG